MITFDVSLLIICLILSGFFSSSETALFSISNIKSLHVSRDGTSTGRLIHQMKEDSNTLLTTILIGNNLVNIGASALATGVAFRYFESNAVSIATGVMTLLILVFGEIFPKSFASENSLLVARAVIYPIYWLSKIFWPFIQILKLLPPFWGSLNITKETVTEDELMTMVEVVEEGGEIKEEEREYITNLFEFDDTFCSEIMTPRADMYVLDVEERLDIKAILQTGFSRIPIIEDTIDNIIGILHVKDLFNHYLSLTNGKDHNDGLNVKKIMKKPYFVPETKTLDSLLQDFKSLKAHMAVVVDEHGGVSGIVTLEDLVEELIGDINDETDQEPPDVVRLKGNKWLVTGKIAIDDLNREMEIEVPESNNYDTLSGFFLEQVGQIPKAGDSVEIDNWTAMVKEMDGNRIHSFILEKG